ncbi:hypothetical protein SAMN05216598_5260 [Pseudomonas asplenii]|uniref:Transcription factor zinc-finger domain-containing protein n=1 Tax=Pseudomonas asplenii TaxID=53407 RepID=A0A1H1ZRL3_9PSED|nr:hypothetical protein SAMN05216598_5260 [Pseudomonas asplenii]
MKLCPFCLQDVVWRVQLKTMPEYHFLMCFECDSVWLEDQPVSDLAGTVFEKYMQSLGLAPGWKDIEKLEPLRRNGDEFIL